MANVAKSRFKIGADLVVELECDSITDLMERSAFFAELTRKVLPTQRVQFHHRQAKGYDFYALIDIDSGKELEFGQRKEGKGFWPKEWITPKYGQSEARDEDEPPRETDDEPPPQRPAPQRPPPTGGGVGAPPARPPQTRRY